MKTIQIKLYKFDELHEKAQKKAIEEHRNTITEYHFTDEALNSLEKFADYFGSKLINWEIDFFNCGPSFAKFAEVEEIEEEGLKELILKMGSYNPETLEGLGDCKLTGVCFDENLADGARKAFFNGERNVNEILKHGFNSWLKAVHADTEYMLSDEGIKEELINNDFDFTEDGKKY